LQNIHERLKLLRNPHQSARIPRILAEKVKLSGWF